MNQDNFYKKLRIICLILAIICMGLSLVKRAKAASAPDYVIDYYESLIDNSNIQSQQKESLMNLFNTYSNTILFVYPNNNWCILVFPHDDMGFCSRDSNTSVNYIWGGVTSTDYYSSSGISTYINSSDYEANGYYIIQYVSQYNSIYCTKYYGANIYSKDYGTYLYYGGSRVSQFGLSGYGDFPYTSSGFNKDETICYINDSTNVYTFYITQFNRSYYYYRKLTSDSADYNNIEELPKPPSTNTDGFKVYKTTRSGRDYLIFDGLNAVPVNIRNGNWYITDLTSTLGFTITTETGSYDYSYTFDIDDASEEFPYNGTYFKWQDQWSNLYLRWEIPINELNLPDDAYGFTENVIMTVSNNVSINNVNVPYLGQFIYLSPVYLYGTQAESGLIDPESAPAPVIPENPINQETRNKNYQSLVYGTLLNKSGLEFEEWKQDLQSGIIWYEVLVTQAPSLQDLINDFPNFSTSDIEKFVFGCSDKDEFENDMETDLQKNSFSQYIDYIVYIYNGSDAYHSSKFDYYIFETSKGREKAISFLLDTNNIYFDKQFDILKDSIPYMKASIDRIDTNLFNLGEDIFSQNNSIIANLISIDNKFNDLEDLLKDFLNKILDALQGINIDIPAADYSSITSRLDQIISNQGTGNLNNDWYDDYRSWLYGKDETDNIISPHEFFIEVFVPIKNTYDAFVNNNAIAGYVADMDLFVQYLSGKIDDNLSIYFKDGIGSAQFDINDNTMLTAGGT